MNSPNPETSTLALGLSTARLCTALDRLRLAALTVDVSAHRTPACSVHSARAALSAGLRKALERLRRGIALAEIALDGRAPEVAAVFLLMGMDEAAPHLSRAARSSLARLRTGRSGR